MLSYMHKLSWYQALRGVGSRRGDLHHVPGGESLWDAVCEWNGDWDGSEGEPVADAMCGRTIRPCAPGVMSRLGAPRCRACCEALGIPQGDGCPINDSQFENVSERN